ncbi:MAG: hypothetical protein Q8S26_03185 [Azonexus sp.]|nr:hypothetical protein [Azonexus sp.]
MSKDNKPRDTADRRQKECGPPRGWKDRRRSTERRIPEINETEVSDADWLLYFGGAKSAPVIATTHAGTEISADVFDRVRD